MRITQVFAPGPFGGLEQVVTQLCAGLAGRDHEVSTLVIVEQGDRDVPYFVNDLVSRNVRVEIVRTPHRAYLRERHAVHALLDSIRPGVVHTHGYHADVLLRSVAQGLRIPTLATVHGFTGGGRKNRVFEWLQRWSLGRMDRVAAVSGPVAQRLISAGVPGSRIVVIRNAWAAPGAFLAREEARKRLGIGPSDRVIGWVGRLTPEKGPDVALEALGRTAPGLTLSFVGSGRMMGGLQIRARELGIESRIRWHGAVPDAWQYFRAFDGYCLSSHTEGTPMALLEAMAAGVPIVATRVGGVPDVVSDSEAILVPPGDAGALAAAMQAATHEEQSVRIAAAGRRLETRFAMDDWLSAYEDLYRDMTSSKVDR